MIIDCDAHFTPTLPCQGSTSACSWLQSYLDRKKDRFSDAEKRVAELEMLGVDKQILNPMGVSLKLFYDIDPAIAGEVMRTYNDTMHEITKPHAALQNNLWLALQDLDACIHEIDRMKDSGYFAVHVSEVPCWGLLNHLEPLWHKLNTSLVPLYVHLTTGHDDLPQSIKLNQQQTQLSNLLGNRWMFSLSTIITSGLLDRYPELRIVVAERDIDWIPDFVNHIESVHDVDALFYIRRNFWFTTEPEMPHFKNAVKYLGADRLLFATDWPHDHDIGGANSRYDVKTMQLLDLTSQEKQLICAGNYQYLSNRK